MARPPFRLRLLVILHDLLMSALAWLAAWLVRFNLNLPPEPFASVLVGTLPAAVLLQGVVNWRMRLYRGVWRFASLPDLANIVRAAVIGTVVLVLALFLVMRLEDFPRSLPLIYPLFLVALLAGPRLAWRLYKDRALGLPVTQPGCQRVMVVGAGRTGAALVRELLHSPGHAPVGFVDDRPDLQRQRIHGLPVLGGVEELAAVCARVEADAIVIAVPAATGPEMQRIVRACEASGLPFRTLPRLVDLMNGNQASLADLRAVAIEDLLGREQVRLDRRVVQEQLGGRVVLVTGGGGSIGLELCRQLLALKPARLVVCDQCELNLFEAERELEGLAGGGSELHFVLADVCDAEGMRRLCETHRPAFVYHAAAYKHVPIMERQPREAVRNNVLGTATVMRAAARAGCETFVLISSDKAVRPSSVMGASKRLAEMLCEAAQTPEAGRAMAGRAPGMRQVVVRFGNVLRSTGSVVPIFEQQIARGGPVTLTHPDMRRYFMSIPEAAQLIVQASVIGKGGEVFVLDMGEPVRIADLAEQLIRLAGKRPHQDIRIEVTGLRPGEKLTEELFYSDESVLPTGHPKILLARARPIDAARLEALMSALEEACTRADDAGVRRLLAEAVPEYAGADAGADVVPFRRRGQQLP
jgi:FlaA1/EpsC-like NDP-sugar epimerase